MNERRRARHLDPDERVLWETVARTAEPLRGGKAASPPADSEEPKPKKASASAKTPSAPATAPTPAPPPAPAKHRLEPIDRRLHTRLGRGTASVDGRLDLHGLTQREAHNKLRSFLAEAQRRNARLVLVITGKGRAERASLFEDQRGVLRRSVPQWLSSPEFRVFVSGFDEAHRTHGGGGALYVRVRKLKAGAG
jgi:DNA-nicking Smr family endonuclease